MNDFYDDDLPEPYVSWADSLSQNRETIKTVSSIVSIPVGLFALTCVANYFLKKKVESL